MAIIIIRHLMKRIEGHTKPDGAMYSTTYLYLTYTLEGWEYNEWALISNPSKVKKYKLTTNENTLADMKTSLCPSY